MKKKKMKKIIITFTFLAITLSQLFGMMLVNKTLFNSQFSTSEINEESYEDDFLPYAFNKEHQKCGSFVCN